MLLHLGGDEMVSFKDVIAVMNLEIAQMSKETVEFLDIAREEGFIKRISKEEPKSFVLAEVNHKSIIYFSPISSNTLIKRMGFMDKVKKCNK
ncbi:DUF370 domain-containing protein [Irregularibacter muris]|uniref:DUF370 domain-containing protein n=1 Tax=Irregularibacter muris TaxID=1796619 RepID=A0AAE3HH04_9FIRM|nr:DUF370 domain-containing protein [Irregularibacter muris]MCR1899240.1 DUF370 domain-containing protein [Irregularibacter muris]